MTENDSTPAPTEGHLEGDHIPGIIRGLADLPAQTILDVNALAHLFSRCTKSIQRAVRRGELPPPQKLMGRHTWTAGAILEHYQRRQAVVEKQAESRNRRIAEQIP